MAVHCGKIGWFMWKVWLFIVEVKSSFSTIFFHVKQPILPRLRTNVENMAYYIERI